MDIEDLLRHRGGAARTETLRRAGHSRTRVAKAVASGRIVRLRRGVYGLPDEAGVLGLALRHTALVTCVSAAPAYQLWTLQKADAMHVCQGHRKSLPGMVMHGRIRHPVHPWLPVAGLADVLIHALHCLPVLQSLVMVQCATQRGDVTVDFLRRKLPGNRNARARAVLDYVVPRADSILEVLANYHFLNAGLQVRRHVELQGVGEVDFLVEDCLVVETDGATHLEPRQVKKDRHRDNASVKGGLLSLHYFYQDVVHRPEEMVNEVLTVFRHREVGRFAPARYAPGWVPPSYSSSRLHQSADRPDLLWHEKSRDTP